jgi:C4-dicarboxylate-specific signal transduction histidine kinase
MAHELNQPLTAVLANTQAASRMLNDEPPELSSARGAMLQAVEQARRASDVVGRLRRAVERPDSAAHMQPVELEDAVRNALYLLEPEFKRHHVVPQTGRQHRPHHRAG